MEIVGKVLEEIVEGMRRREFLHGSHFDEILEFVVKLKVPLANSDLCDLDGLVVVLDSGNDVIIIGQLNPKVGDLVVFDGLFEGVFLCAVPEQHE